MSNNGIGKLTSDEDVAKAVEKIKKFERVLLTAYNKDEWLMFNKEGGVVCSGGTEEEAGENYMKIKNQEPVYITQLKEHLSPKQKAINYDLKPKLPVYG